MWVALKVALGDNGCVSGGLNHVVNMRGARGITDSIGRRFDGFVFVITFFIGYQPDTILEIGFGRLFSAAVIACGG